jgi:hypothetical protein
VSGCQDWEKKKTESNAYANFMSEKDLKQLEAAMESCREKYSKAKEQYESALRIFVTDKYNCAPGSLIITRKREVAKVGLVYKTWGPDSPPWLKVSFKKMDGTWGAPTHTEYSDWTPATPAT